MRRFTGAVATAAVTLLMVGCADDPGPAGEATRTPDSAPATPRTKPPESSPLSPSSAPPSPSTTPAPSTSPEPTTSRPQPAPLLVDFRITGGFIGRQDRLLLRTDGTYTVSTRSGPGRTERLAPAELAALRTDLTEADLGSLPTRMIDPNARDLFEYRITHDGRTIVTDRTRRMPALEKVIDELERLLTENSR
ncbi:hypothetical protein [Streptomyces cavernae]|uniref:hypothetical protein n=1 Tax=Streptomyces cavernae TaxID=2259034 RepID=UPI000FEB7A19|nr:hypothetical protein [Streptomyces cavernae]